MRSEEIKGGGFHRLFLCLGGGWLLERNYSNGSYFKGTAEFTPIDGSSFRLIEQGGLKLENSETELSAKREWIWRLEENNQLIISYPPHSGSQTYHDILLRDADDSWSGEALHHCAPDQYLGNYRFLENQFTVDHKVTGPKKDYSFEARYIRNN